MARRKYGHGTIFQRGDSGRWVGRLPDGRGGHRYVTGTDREDVRRRLEEARRERDRTTSATRGGARLRDLVMAYQATVDPVRNRPKTVANNAQHARDHILPAMGNIRVRQLEPRDVQRMVDGIIARGLKPRTAGNVVHTLSAVLRWAMVNGDVDRNVASLVTIPQDRRERLPSLTTAQLAHFLEATREEPLWPVWALLGTTGLRKGELLGLRWKDIGPGDATITVSGQYRTVQERDEDGRRADLVFVREDTKTRTSRRLIHVPALGREALRVQRAQATSAIVVFARADGGGPLNGSWLTRRFHDALTAHGLPLVRIHSLRHSAAVLMLDATGGDIRAVSAVLGHSSVSITNDLYGAEADEARRKAAAAVDGVLRTKEESA